jgi:8-oxo-dGTP pyrophosphatase MutT (NUDIX family)
VNNNNASSSIKTAVSAGGVVYRLGQHGIEIVLCGRTAEGLWALPKGSPEQGEALVDTALREVREETGLSVAIEQSVGSIRYQFKAPDGTQYDKTVEHHLMVPVGGELGRHDAEFDVVRWVPVEEALRLLRYVNERDIVRRAVRLIQDRAQA